MAIFQSEQDSKPSVFSEASESARHSVMANNSMDGGSCLALPKL